MELPQLRLFAAMCCLPVTGARSEVVDSLGAERVVRALPGVKDFMPALMSERLCLLLIETQAPVLEVCCRFVPHISDAQSALLDAEGMPVHSEHQQHSKFYFNFLLCFEQAGGFIPDTVEPL
eukprot:1407392-Rhodomonas_salina.2